MNVASLIAVADVIPGHAVHVFGAQHQTEGIALQFSAAFHIGRALGGILTPVDGASVHIAVGGQAVLVKGLGRLAGRGRGSLGLNVFLFLRDGHHADELCADVAPMALIVDGMPVLAVAGGLAGDVDHGIRVQHVDDAAHVALHLAEGHIFADHHAVAGHLRRFGGGGHHLGRFGGLVDLHPVFDVGLGLALGDLPQRAVQHIAGLIVQRGHDGPHIASLLIDDLVDHRHQLVGVQGAEDGHVGSTDAVAQGSGALGERIAVIGRGRGCGRCGRRGRLVRKRLQGMGGLRHRGEGGHRRAAGSIGVAPLLGHDIQVGAHHVADAAVHIDHCPDFMLVVVKLLEHEDLAVSAHALDDGLVAAGGGRLVAQGNVSGLDRRIAVHVLAHRDGRLHHLSLEDQHRLPRIRLTLRGHDDFNRLRTVGIVPGRHAGEIRLDGVRTGSKLHGEGIRDQAAPVVGVADGDFRLLRIHTVVEGQLLRLGGAVVIDSEGQVLLHHQLRACGEVLRVRLHGIIRAGLYTHILGVGNLIAQGVLV